MFGKVLFALCDILVGILLLSISQRTPVSTKFTLKPPPTITKSKPTPSKSAEMAASLPSSTSQTSPLFWISALWLLNPMPANISTRGSAESVLGLLVILTLSLTTQRRYNAAAVLLGLAVHFKIYPFVYGASILASMRSVRPGARTRSARRQGTFSALASLVTKERVRFTVISASTFGALNVIMYSMYAVTSCPQVPSSLTKYRRWGQPFLEHTYLYHLTRKDHRHNFSPYFYPIYIAYSRLSGVSPPSSVSDMVQNVLSSSLVSFVPQMGLTIGSGFVLGRRTEDLPFAWFVQTVVFVTFNKVCTSQVSAESGIDNLCPSDSSTYNLPFQYFLWYLWFLPLVILRLNMSGKKALFLLGLWVGAQVSALNAPTNHEYAGLTITSRLSGSPSRIVLNCWEKAYSFRFGVLVLCS